MIFEYPLKKQKSWVLVGMVTLSVLMTTAWASQELLQDRRVTLEMAREMVGRIPKGKGHLPVDLDESAVLEQLNAYLGSPESRERVRNSLKRMKEYDGMINSAIQSYELPPELLAVPFTESGFTNAKRSIGAGIWMFIAKTARRFKLRVDAKNDDRLIPKEETRAAMDLLKEDFELFQDWRLALLAYNAGEKKVLEGIEKTSSKDVWTLIRSGYQGDKNYVPMVMAAILIVNNPGLAD